MVHYEAVYTDSGCCMLGCEHKHKTVTTATNCISEPGGFVVRVSRNKYCELNEAEEAEFQRATYGDKKKKRQLRLPLFGNSMNAGLIRR
jgi:hypothetical protein